MWKSRFEHKKAICRVVTQKTREREVGERQGCYCGQDGTDGRRPIAGLR